METKDKVKQRRNERLRMLREHPTMGAYPSRPPTSPLKRDEPELVYTTDSERANRLADPEYAWRQKFKQDTARYAVNMDDGSMRGWLTPPSGKTIWTKLAISVVLFAAAWGLFQLSNPWAEKGKLYVKAALTQSFDFQAAADWYEGRFGNSPSFIPSFRSKGGEEATSASTTKRTYFTPVHGKIVTSFESMHTGMILQTQSEAPVYALDTGQVIFAGFKDDTGNTIIIRHPGGIESIYGKLSVANVEVNDWIKGGEAIGKASKGSGTVGTGTAYVAIQKDGRAINPTDVITFD
jgi:stage IV sporulation protein FA